MDALQTRNKINAKQKRTIAPRTETVVQASTPTATPSQLDVEIPQVNSGHVIEATNQLQGMINQEVRGEHSPELLTPTSIVNLLEDDDHIRQKVRLPWRVQKSERPNKDAVSEGHP